MFFVFLVALSVFHQVVLADHDWTTRRESQEMRFGISAVKRHPRFDRAAKFDFDFALLRLDRRIEFALRPDVRPACLPDATEDDLLGRVAQVSGWGVVNPLSPNKQARKLQVRKIDKFPLIFLLQIVHFAPDGFSRGASQL